MLHTYLSAAFIERMMQSFKPNHTINVLDCQPFIIDNSASILAVLTAGSSAESLIGHYGLRVRWQEEGVENTRAMVLKIKPHGREIVAMLTSLATACGSELAAVYPAYQERTGFANTHGRELDVYAHLPAPLQPDIFGVWADDEHSTYLILMEYLSDVTLLNAAMNPAAWIDAHIRQALDQLADWHAAHLDRPLPLNPAYWTDAPSRAYMTELQPLWSALLDNAATHHPALYTPARTARLRQVIDAIPTYWQELNALPKTLVHNDANPRNTCFKHPNGQLQLCLYDWELATYHIPQYDVVELLCFVLDEDRYALRPTYLTHYQQALHQRTGRYPDPVAFRHEAMLAAYDFGLHRLGMYIMAHTVGPYPFLPRVVNSYFNWLETEGV